MWSRICPETTFTFETDKNSLLFISDNIIDEIEIKGMYGKGNGKYVIVDFSFNDNGYFITFNPNYLFNNSLNISIKFPLVEEEFIEVTNIVFKTIKYDDKGNMLIEACGMIDNSELNKFAKRVIHRRSRSSSDN